MIFEPLVVIFWPHFREKSKEDRHKLIPFQTFGQEKVFRDVSDHFFRENLDLFFFLVFRIDQVSLLEPVLNDLIEDASKDSLVHL